MATVDTLLVKIEADMKGLRGDLNKIKGQTTQVTNSMSNSFAKVGKAVKLLGPLIATGIAAKAIKSFVNTGTEIENLQVRLKVLFGSAKEGEKAFKVMTKFASEVPFSLKEIQKAAGTLGATVNNAEDLNAILRITGNVAASTGMGIADAASQIQRAFSAGANSADMFRERGVLAMTGFEAGVKVSAQETIVKFQEAYGPNGKFSQATADLAKTFGGTMSMLGDSIFNFQATVADSGLMDALKDLVKVTKGNADEAKSFAHILGMGLASAVRGLTRAIQFCRDNIVELSVALVAFVAFKSVTMVVAMATAFITLSKAILQSKMAMAALNVVTKKGPLALLTVAIMASIIAFEKMGGSLEKIKEKIADITESFFPFKGEAKETSDNMDKLNKKITDLSKSLGKGAQESLAFFTKGMLDIKQETAAATLELQGYNAEQIELLKNQKKLVEFASGQTPLDEKTKKQIESLGKEVEIRDAARRSLDDYNDSISDAKSAVESAKTEQQKLNETIENLKIALAGNKITQKEYDDALEATNKKLFESTELGKAYMDAAEQVSASVSQGIADVLTNSGDGLKNWREKLIGILNSVIQKIIETKIQAMFMNKAIAGGGGGGGFSLGGIFKGIAGLFGGGSSGGHVGGAIGYEGQTLAGGGRISGPSIVGERGPELFIPNSVGSIMNNANARSMMSSGESINITQNINVTTGVQQTVRTEIMDMMPLIQAKTSQAVIDSRQRGGSFATALTGS
jgi:hypothetical protein